MILLRLRTASNIGHIWVSRGLLVDHTGQSTTDASLENRTYPDGSSLEGAYPKFFNIPWPVYRDSHKTFIHRVLRSSRIATLNAAYGIGPSNYVLNECSVAYSARRMLVSRSCIKSYGAYIETARVYAGC